MKHTTSFAVAVNVNVAGIQLYCFIMENSIVQIIIVLLFPNYLLLLKALLVGTSAHFR